MTDTENLGSFFEENKNLVRDYIETRIEILRLSMIRMSARSAGCLIWIIVLLLLSFLLIMFLGLVTGFWLSDLTGSYVKGFGLTTLILLAVIIIFILLRKVVFVNPVIRAIINSAGGEDESEKDKPAI